MRKILNAVVLTTSILTALTVTSFAQNATPPAPGQMPPPGPGMQPPMMRSMQVPCALSMLRLVSPRSLPVLTNRLQLTAEQQAKISDMLNKAQKDLAPIMDAQKKASDEFAQALSKENIKEAELIPYGEKAMKAESEMLAQQVKMLFAIKALLTPEQNKELAKSLEQYSAPWRGGDPRLGGPGGPGPGRPGGPGPAPAGAPTPAPTPEPAASGK